MSIRYKGVYEGLCLPLEPLPLGSGQGLVGWDCLGRRAGAGRDLITQSSRDPGLLVFIA
jgi:hypothetical protein